MVIRVRSTIWSWANLLKIPSWIPPLTDDRSILGGERSPTSDISSLEETLGTGPSSLPGGCGLSHILSTVVWCPLPWGHTCAVMLWCCATLSRTPHSVGCAGLECRRHRAQLCNCLPRLPRRRSEVGGSPLSKFSFLIVSSPVFV